MILKTISQALSKLTQEQNIELITMLAQNSSLQMTVMPEAQ